MSGVSVKQLAEVLSVSVDRLLSQLGKAGMEFETEDQTVSDDEKMKLLDFLRDIGKHFTVNMMVAKEIDIRGAFRFHQEFGDAVGADAYCRDAATAVEIAKKLVQEQRAS